MKTALDTLDTAKTIIRGHLRGDRGDLDIGAERLSPLRSMFMEFRVRIAAYP